MFLSCHVHINLYSIVAWKSRDSLLKTGSISDLSILAKCLCFRLLSGFGFKSCTKVEKFFKNYDPAIKNYNPAKKETNQEVTDMQYAIN